MLIIVIKLFYYRLRHLVFINKNTVIHLLIIAFIVNLPSGHPSTAVGFGNTYKLFIDYRKHGKYFWIAFRMKFDSIIRLQENLQTFNIIVNFNERIVLIT